MRRLRSIVFCGRGERLLIKLNFESQILSPKKIKSPRLCSKESLNTELNSHVLVGTHDYLGVPYGVLRHRDPVLLLLPVRRLVVDVGDDDGELHGAAAVPSVRCHDLLVDPGRLQGSTAVV